MEMDNIFKDMRKKYEDSVKELKQELNKGSSKNILDRQKKISDKSYTKAGKLWE